jgi:ankyrin repeat protein
MYASGPRKKLHEAARTGDVKAAKMLLCCEETFEEIDERDAQGRTPLMLAVAREDSDTALALTKLLLASGANEDAGALPLCLVVRHPSVAKWLQERHDYVSKLHFFEDIEMEALTARLGAGAALLGQRGKGATSRSVLALANASTTEAARLVRSAALPYGRSTARLWPRFARARAVDLQLLLSRTSLAPLNDLLVAQCIGDRVAVENWKFALLALRFVIKLRKLLRSAC